jgi:hypothetical protein
VSYQLTQQPQLQPPQRQPDATEPHLQQPPEPIVLPPPLPVITFSSATSSPLRRTFVDPLADPAFDPFLNDIAATPVDFFDMMDFPLISAAKGFME